MTKPDLQEYWKSNLRAVAVLLTIWFVVGYVMSILMIESLNTLSVGKIGLGFWFAQQGSIFVFVILVAAYAWWMDRLDRKYQVEE